MKKYILGSSSPRRQYLLKEIGINFEIIKPDFDEDILGKNFSYELIEDIAENKALSIKNKIDFNAIIISADTVVINNNIVLGKPIDFNDAFKMLTELNNKTHRVVTAVCIIDTQTNTILKKSETSYVTFNNLTNDEITSYINDFKPFDKAGSYGIQELPKNFINKVEGDFNNIVGLPTQLVIEMLHEIENK
jgi:septum formation protein